MQAAIDALHHSQNQTDEKRRSLGLALQKGRYEANRIERQYQATEPENRLVAAELEKRWNNALTHERKPNVRIDLTGVTFIDTPGKACLATMHHQGAEFIAHDCMTKDVVREICEDRSRTMAPETSA